MHYRPFSFNKDPSVPTITTKIPEFFNIIGQYLDFSEMDTLRLNRMYNCCMFRQRPILSVIYFNIYFFFFLQWICRISKSIKCKPSIILFHSCSTHAAGSVHFWVYKHLWNDSKHHWRRQLGPFQEQCWGWRSHAPGEMHRSTLTH